MKKFAAVLAFSTVLALGATAKAADMVPPAAYDWTGVYVGGNIGYAFSGQDDVGIAVSNGNFIDSDTLQLSGIFGGAQIGADWQASSAVFGVLADIEAADIKDDFNGVVSDGVTTDAKSEIDVFGTVRGRLGWAFDRVS
jgi:outer membrane immunogenic protein